MPDISTLHARLDTLSHKLFQTKSKPKRHGKWHDGHAKTSKELALRYAELKAPVDDDIARDGAIDHHVTGLEISLREWSTDLDDDTE